MKSLIRRLAFFLKKKVGLPALGLLLAIVFGCFMGLGSYTFYYGEGLSYFSKDPRACVNCHIMQPQYDSWQKASHHGVATCVDCHLPHTLIPKWIAKAENGFFHSKAFTFQDFHEPIIIKEKNAQILQNNCLNCHGTLVHGLTFKTTAKANALRCVHCHRSVGHGDSTGLGNAYPLPKSHSNPKYP